MVDVRVFRKDRRHKRYHIEFCDHRGVVRRLSSGSRDKSLATWLGRNLERLVSAKQSAAPLPHDIVEWVDGTMPDRIKELLLKWGILDRGRVMQGRPIQEHLEAWRDDLIANGRTTRHAVTNSYGRVKRICDECGYKFYTDINAESVMARLAQWRSIPKKLGGVSSATSDHYLGAIKSFCRWMQRSSRAVQNPMQWIRPLNDRRKLVHNRRPLSVDEQRRLLSVTQDQPYRFKMTGLDRALLYRLAMETGLRSSALRSLTKKSLHLDQNPPFVQCFDKGGKERIVPLRSATVDLLRSRVSMMTDHTTLFNMPRAGGMSSMIYRDLEAAGIQISDANGRVVDFHALRTTFGTNLARSGVHPKLAQDLMGHSDINLTMQLYTHTMIEERSVATDCLPDLDEEKSNESQTETA